MIGIAYYQCYLMPTIPALLKVYCTLSYMLHRASKGNVWFVSDLFGPVGCADLHRFMFSSRYVRVQTSHSSLVWCTYHTYLAFCHLSRKKKRTTKLICANIAIDISSPCCLHWLYSLTQMSGLCLVWCILYGGILACCSIQFLW